MSHIITVYSAWTVFFQGLLSFFTPCVLPLIPVYITFLSGQSADNASGKNRARLVLNGFGFVLGFTAVFVALGASATALGSFLQHNLVTIRIASGVLIILLGVLQTGLIPVKLLQREYRPNINIKRAPGFLTSVLFGVAFCFGWSPCYSAVISSVLVMASTMKTVLHGMWLLFVYSMGLAVPFMVIAVFMKFMTKPLRVLNKYSGIVKIISGLLMITIGVLVLLDKFKLLSQIG